MLDRFVVDYGLRTYRGRTLEDIICEGNPVTPLIKKGMRNATICSSYMELYIGGDNFDDTATNKAGYDYFLDDYWTIKAELKCTWTEVGNSHRLCVGSFQQKKGLFHFMHVVDMVSDREFMIPHDDWFDRLGKRKSFYWSISYMTENDRVCKEDTLWLLKYEVPNEVKDRC